MGLDMHLRVRRYVSGWSRINSSEEQNEWERLLALYPGIEEYVPENSPSAYVEISVGYWRKANHTHQWFVDEVQDGRDECQPSYVSRAQLKDLRETCLRVLAHPEAAEEYLPTQGGFFGDTEYGDYYREECERTVKLIDHLLELPDDWDFVYQSSW